MTERDFCYWLQGYFEIAGDDSSLTPERLECVKRHLSMVFEHTIDPSYGDKKKQETLNVLHAHPGGSGGSTLIRC